MRSFMPRGTSSGLTIVWKRQKLRPRSFIPRLQSVEITGIDGESVQTNHTVQIEFVEPSLPRVRNL